MKPNSLIFALPLVALAIVGRAAPAAAADKEQRQMMADIRMLQEQTQQLQNTLAALTDALKAMDARLGARIDEQAEAARKALADEKTIVSSISNDLRGVREKVDDNTTRVGSLTVEVQALRQLVTTSRPVVAPPDTATDALSQPDTPPSVAPVSSAALGASPTKLFEQAYGDYALGQWDLAIQGFLDFIKSYPNHPQADEAQVMICNAYLTDGKYDKAVDACDQAIRTYPNGSATPDAYYRKGLALKGLKQGDRAREAFDYVVKNFPDSQAASLATTQLMDLKKP
jgi:tol-pal system protein YbgF